MPPKTCGRASILLAVGTFVLRAGEAAAGSAHGGEHVPSVGDLFFPVINFLLFLYLVRRAGGGAIRQYLRERRGQVVSALEAARTARAEAERVHAEAGSRLARVEEEAARLRGDMHAAAELERDRRLKLAAGVAARIGSDARLVADQEVLAARAALRSETVSAVVAETVGLLRREIGGPDHERFLGAFLEEVRVGR